MGTAVAGAIVASAAVVAALAGVVQLGRWRATAEAPAAWLGAGLFVYSGAALAVPAVAILVSPAAATSTSGPALLRPVAVPVVLALFAAAACSPGTRGLGRTIGVAGACGGVAVVAFASVVWSPTVHAILGPSLVSGPEPGLASTGQLVVAAGWLALAGAFARRALRAGDVGWWVTVMLVALAASRLCLSLGGGAGSVALAGSQTFRVAAVVAALTGALRGLQSLVVTLRQELLVTKVELRRERAHLEVVEAEESTRRHQLCNGLAAIGGSAWLLEHHGRALDAGTRAHLVEGVTGEVRRLQRLLDHPITEGER